MTGPVAIITGSAQGYGFGIARRLGSDGAAIVVADIAADKASAAAEELRGAGANVVGIAADVSDEASVQALVDETLKRFGRIDILVNNAGVHVQALLVDTPVTDWDRIFSVNARGTFLCCRAVAPHMIAARRGRIVNVVSRMTGIAYSSAYIASKHAVWGLTQCLVQELSPYGITVNAIGPGPSFETGMGQQHRKKAELVGQDFDEFRDALVRRIPAGRMCEPADVAAAVAYLVSDEASYVTGELLNVAGGYRGYSAPVVPTERS